MDIQEVRRTNLKRITGEHASVAEFARYYVQNETYIRQILTGHSAFGEKVARRLEKELLLPPLTLDVAADATRSGMMADADLIARVGRLTESDRDRLRGYLDLLEQAGRSRPEPA